MEGVANTGLTSGMLIGVSGERGPTPPIEGSNQSSVKLILGQLTRWPK